MTYWKVVHVYHESKPGVKTKTKIFLCHSGVDSVHVSALCLSFSSSFFLSFSFSLCSFFLSFFLHSPFLLLTLSPLAHSKTEHLFLSSSPPPQHSVLLAHIIKATVYSCLYLATYVCIRVYSNAPGFCADNCYGFLFTPLLPSHLLAIGTRLLMRLLYVPAFPACSNYVANQITALFTNFAYMNHIIQTTTESRFVHQFTLLHSLFN